VLTDRYIYSAIARAEVRGIDAAWIRSIYEIALIPDAVFYLKIATAQQLVERVLNSGRGFDYWESGMDVFPRNDFYDSFIEYQTRMLAVFDRMSREYGFHVLDASASVRRVGSALKRAITRVIEEDLTAEPRIVQPIKRMTSRAATKIAGPSEVVD
jgi:dTMP kinase